MTHPIWPLFDLRVHTPLIELRYVDDELGVELANLAARGIHDPSFMPFAFEWTDAPTEQLLSNTLQHFWKCRSETSPTHWHLNFAVIAAGVVVGSTSLGADHFPDLRTFESGSWLGIAHQGKGLGKELRRATLHLGFAGLGARRATTSAFADNAPSLGVTRSLGYEPNGDLIKLRRGRAATTLMFALDADDWDARLRSDDITIDGLDACLPFLGCV